jgi:hypothetical protein
MRVGDPVVLENTPTGRLMIGEIVESTWEGERFQARQRGAAGADWLNLAPDGSGRVDVRLTLETHDAALVFVNYTGRFDPASGTAYTTPQFTTGDARYAWMNRIQAVGKASFDAEKREVHYPMIYELR